MKKQLFLILAVLLFGFGAVRAQDATPTPTPSPTPAATPIVTDKQNVQPENLQGVPAIAPNYQNNDLSLPDLGRVGVDMTQQKTLTLRDAITMALENNKDIEVTRENVRGAEFDLQAARGVYETRFTGQTYFEHATVPNVSIFSTQTKIKQNSFVGNAGLQGYIPKFGTILSSTINNQRVGSDNSITVLSPQYNSSLVFSVTQPILRGRTFDQNRRQIEISKRNLSLTDTQFRQKTIDVIANVQRAYWDLTYALRNLQVQRDSVRDAKDQLEHNRRLVNEGQLAPIDIVAAETQVANFEQAVYDALNTVTINENNLKNLIAPNRSDTIWSASIVPVDPIDLDAPPTTLPEALDAALQNRPELEVNQTQAEINRIDQRFYREQDKPQVDLVASYTSSGIAGALNPGLTNIFAGSAATTTTLNNVITRVNALNTTLPPIATIPITTTQNNSSSLTGGNFSSFSDIFANRYPTFRVGVNFNLPLFGNKTAKANLGKSLVDADRIKTQREQIEQNIQVDVRNALQTLRTAEARLRAATIARENSQKQYESEQRKLDSGQSDVYKVLDRQTALAASKSNEIRAQTELNKAIGDLQRATGNSLKANNVQARLTK